MQISFYKNSNNINKINGFTKANPIEKTKISDTKTNSTTNETQKFYANNLASLGVNFKGKNKDNEKTLEQLRNEYDWYVNIDKTDPIDAFLKIKTKEKSMNELFVNILTDENASYKLIDSIAGKARDGFKNMETLKNLLGENSDNLRFFMYSNPYNQAFTRYMEQKYENAKCMESLLKLRPDWRESALIDKYEALHGNRDLKIGNLPAEFKNGVFEQIHQYIQQYCQFYGHKKSTEIPPLTIGNKTYHFEYFTEGKTDKNVFGVYTPEKKYVFKIADKGKRSLNEPFSLGALALIDSYLTLNNCRNIAPIYYYDHNLNTCIYKYQDHNKVSQKFKDPNEVNHYMPDFKSLGMCYNDTVGNDNYFLSDVDCKTLPPNNTYYNAQSKELISVDNDHVTFNSPFMLLVTKYNVPLPNAMQTTF